MTRRASTLRAEVEVFDRGGRRLRIGDIVQFRRGNRSVQGRVVGWKRNGQCWVEYTHLSGKSVRAPRVPAGVELATEVQLTLDFGRPL